MSFDRTEEEYHLTPDGWVKGSFLVYGEGNKIPPPNDRIETWVVEKYQSSGFADEKVTKKLVWTLPDFPEDKREALKKEFPFPPISILKQVYYGNRKKRK